MTNRHYFRWNFCPVHSVSLYLHISFSIFYAMTPLFISFTLYFCHFVSLSLSLSSHSIPVIDCNGKLIVDLICFVCLTFWFNLISFHNQTVPNLMQLIWSSTISFPFNVFQCFFVFFFRSFRLLYFFLLCSIWINVVFHRCLFLFFVFFFFHCCCCWLIYWLFFVEMKERNANIKCLLNVQGIHLTSLTLSVNKISWLTIVFYRFLWNSLNA